MEQMDMYRAIEKILWEEWDPIGINDTAPRDEYHAYTPAIFRLKINGGDKEAIAKKLYEFETENIGLVGSMKRCIMIADRIMDL